MRNQQYMLTRENRLKYTIYMASVTSLILLSTLLAGCGGALSVPSTNSSSGGQVININNTVTPVPTFPPVTMGAWVSDQSPYFGQTIYLYAIIRTHTLTGPPMPPNPPVQVSITSGASSPPQTTDPNDGIAVFAIQANAQPTQPQVIYLTAVVNGTTLTASTFYTTLPTAPPATTPTATSTAGG